MQRSQLWSTILRHVPNSKVHELQKKRSGSLCGDFFWGDASPGPSTPQSHSPGTSSRPSHSPGTSSRPSHSPRSAQNLGMAECSNYLRQICVNEELKHVSLQTDMSLQENDCRDVHISPDVSSDTITKEDDSDLPSTSISERDGDGSEALVETLNDEEDVSGMHKPCSSGREDAFEPFAQALKEMVGVHMLVYFIYK
ncbi:hypothetical protein Tco_0388830 [Tanacetum coccineum]